ncbi:MAG: hypothetical protein COB24_15075 [Hyphomicrobiales bacterium]|nr:MAG: hypothetical protein COB24_15075 [Hyphomicrobiales bacterium]
MVCNESRDDQHGWDHIVEIEQSKIKNLPADMQAGVVQSLVQIKTTRGNKLTTSLKLSNALKATKADLPCFLLLLKYDNSNSDPEIYGKHIWRADIYKFLKRARQIEEGGSQDVRKIKVSMSFSSVDRIDLPLNEWMLRHIQKVDGNYATAKHKLASQLGYEKSPIKIEITFGELGSPDDIIDHQIGLKADLPVKNFKVSNNRFDISSRLPTHQMSSGRISFQAKPVPMVLELSQPDEGTIQLPVQAFASTLLETTDKRYKFRIVAGHFEMIYIAKGKNHRLIHCYDPYANLCIMQHIGYVFLKKCSEKGSVSFSLSTEEGELFSGQLDIPLDTKEWIGITLLVGRFLIENIGQDRCNQVRIPFVDFFETIKNIYGLATLIETNSVQISADFEGKTDKFSALLGYAYGQIGQWSFGLICSFELLSRDIKGKRESFIFSKAEIIKKSVFKMSIEKIKRHIANEFETYITSTNIQYATIEQGDLIKSFQKADEDAEVSFYVSD